LKGYGFMPRINRFRIVNFKYDDDKKYIANELYEFDGKNALINLENGGGKSVILQLALQSVLPNTNMGSRNFSDYFKVNSSPTHIMIEWALDGVRSDYLLTGICVSKSADGLRFFTYTHNYTLPHDFDIKGMEVLTADKQVIGFSEFYNYLKRLSSEMRLNINVYSKDRQKEYRDKLYTFNLFKEEFDAIKIINQSEGGIDKFFENARKSRSVIEKLIIPNIPMGEGETSRILEDTFKKHLENLKNIPLYQHNIKMYEAFCDKAANLLSKLESYGAAVEEIDKVSRNILALSNLICLATDKLNKEVEELETKDRDYFEKIKELSYKKDSLEYQNKVIELQSLNKELEDILGSIEKIESKIEEKDKKIKYMESASLFEEVLNARKEINTYKAQLETASKKEEEIEREYQSCLFFAKRILVEENEKVLKLIEELKQQLEKLRKEQEAIEKELKEKDSERDSIRDRLSSIKTRLDDNKDRQSKLTSYFVKDMTLLVDSNAGLKNLIDERDKLSDKKRDLTEEIEKANKSCDDISISETRIKEAVAALEQNRKTKNEEIEVFEERFSKINREISMYEIDGDVYSKSALESLKAHKAKVDNSLSEVLGKYHELQKRKLLYEGIEYYIPDMELKKVYEFLKSNGIRCIPGSLWLKNQREDLREEFLHRNPLLCHSIVLEKAEFEKIISDSGKFSLKNQILELVESSPVTFIVDSEDGIFTPTGEDKHSSGIDRLGSMEAYVVFANNNTFALNSDAFADYLNTLAQNILRFEENCKAIKIDQERITGLIERCSEFVKLYPQGYLKEMQSQLDELDKKIYENEASLKELQENKELLKKTIKENENAISNIERLIDEKNTDIANLTEYIELSGKIKELEKGYREEELILVRVEEEKRNLNEELNSTSKKIEDTKRNLEAYVRENQSNKEKLDQISVKLNIDKPAMDIKGSLEEILSRAQGLERKIANSETERIQQFIESRMKDVKRRIKEIHNKGFCEADFEGRVISFSDEELEEEKRKLDLLKAENKRIRENERTISDQIKTLEGEIKEHKKNIEKNFKLEPFEFETFESVDAETFDSQIEAFNRKRQKNSKKLEEIKKRRERLLQSGGRIEDYININKITIRSESREYMDSLVHNGESISMWDMLQLPVERIDVIINENRDIYKNLLEELKQIESTVEKSYDELYKDADWAENVTIRMIIEKIMNNDKYNYTYVKGLFKDIIDSVENMKKGAQLQLEESLRDKNEIVERCYSKAEAVYEELKRVDTYSKINIDGVNRKTIVIEMPQLHPEEGKALMTKYIEHSIEEIEKMKADGKYDPAKIDGEISKIMSPVSLLDAITNLNEYSIKVFKPEATGASRYIPWEVVINWSGGEKLAGFFAMFISIISYLRVKKTGWPDSSKVIWIDNPFGQANAGYLLSYIFELAKGTNTQMICLTGHMQVDIYMQFDVVYSLIHRQLTGMNMSVIQSKLVKSQEGLESAFYKVKSEQMTLF